MTLLIGDSMTNNIDDEIKEAKAKVTVMNAVANSAYLAGIMISLLAFKIAISPAALGPGGTMFAPGIVYYDIGFPHALIAILVGVGIALSITVYLALKYANKMTRVVLNTFLKKQC